MFAALLVGVATMGQVGVGVRTDGTINYGPGGPPPAVVVNGRLLYAPVLIPGVNAPGPLTRPSPSPVIVVTPWPQPPAVRAGVYGIRRGSAITTSPRGISAPPR